MTEAPALGGMRLSRRTVLASGMSAVLAGCTEGEAEPETVPGPPLYDRPRHLVAAVFRGGGIGAEAVAAAAAAVGESFERDGFDASGLSLSTGLGPRPVAAVDDRLPGAERLPEFTREDLSPETRDGDALLLAGADDAVLPAMAVSAFAEALDVEPAWTQRGFSSPRNLMGFHDGTENPESREELDDDVWISEPGGLAGTTIAVVRRLRIDLRRWNELPVEEQERAVGRRRHDGRPLSGADIDLAAKRPDGEYEIPALSHVRRSHPLAAGAGRMLRRGYGYDNGPEDRGLLFISFQNSLRTFTATQRRMDKGDAMMEYTTATASGSFLMLPTDDAGRTTVPAVLERR
ncbi:Dyp-type peroxidase [Salininema proteolyticum]|uniref:Dyp-type peroxidase n=1 Tax=Salininema proteolyticum TaxID=1607685 RepID=A0ABV8U076_9ACTN